MNGSLAEVKALDANHCAGNRPAIGERYAWTQYYVEVAQFSG